MFKLFSSAWHLIPLDSSVSLLSVCTTSGLARSMWQNWVLSSLCRTHVEAVRNLLIPTMNGALG